MGVVGPVPFAGYTHDRRLTMVDRILLARIFAGTAFLCGTIGLVAAIAEREWRLAGTGWFGGGTLLAALALVILADKYVAARRAGDV